MPTLSGRRRPGAVQSLQRPDTDLRSQLRRYWMRSPVARRFLRRLVDVAERTPQRVTTGAHLPYR